MSIYTRIDAIRKRLAKSSPFNPDRVDLLWALEELEHMASFAGDMERSAMEYEDELRRLRDGGKP